MRVLYLNHTGAMSGGERSLLELLAGLPSEVDSTVASPHGPFADAARELGQHVVTVPAAEASLRVHPVHTPIALAAIARAAIAVARLARGDRVDIVHANSVRAGIVASLARRLGGPPVVTYVHDCLPQTTVANLTRRALRSADGIILANSEYTAGCFARGIPGLGVRVTYNGMVDGSGRLISAGRVELPQREDARRGLGFERAGPLLGVVAQITPWKGQDAAIEAFARVQREHPDARLLLVGEAKFATPGGRFDNRAFLDRLRARSRELGLCDSIEFLGERRDALEIIAALDLLIAPSWAEPFGRTIVEAMTIGTPVIAAGVGGPAEIIEDGTTGRLISPRDPEHIAAAALELLASADLRELFATEGRRSITRFSLDAHVHTVVGAYRDLLAGSPAR